MCMGEKTHGHTHTQWGPARVEALHPRQTATVPAAVAVTVTVTARVPATVTGGVVVMAVLGVPV